jgi:hypothetical protein
MRSIPLLLMLAIAVRAPQNNAVPLRDLASARNLRIGTAIQARRLTETDYTDNAAREFNIVTPENEMKFGPIHPVALDCRVISHWQILPVREILPQMSQGLERLACRYSFRNLMFEFNSRLRMKGSRNRPTRSVPLQAFALVRQTVSD